MKDHKEVSQKYKVVYILRGKTGNFIARTERNESCPRFPKIAVFAQYAASLQEVELSPVDVITAVYKISSL